MTTIWHDLLHLFFPDLCLLCRKPLVEGEEEICLHCLADLPRTGFDRTDPRNPVAALFLGKVEIENASAFLRYEKGGHVQSLIHDLKYHHGKKAGMLLGRLAALDYLESGGFEGVDLLLPVPLHPQKQRRRGYNQAEWIAKGIASVVPLPIDTTSLRRIRKTDTQTHRPLYQRWKNVQDVFTLTDRASLQNKHVLLVDDVITTGSTLAACAETLLKAPGIRVSVFGIGVA